MEWYQYPLLWVVQYPFWTLGYFVMAGFSAFAIDESKPTLIRVYSCIIYYPLYMIAAIFKNVVRALPAIILLALGVSKGAYLGVAFYVTAIIIIVVFVSSIENIRHQPD